MRMAPASFAATSRALGIGRHRARKPSAHRRSPDAARQRRAGGEPLCLCLGRESSAPACRRSPASRCRVPVRAGPSVRTDLNLPRPSLPATGPDRTARELAPASPRRAPNPCWRCASVATRQITAPLPAHPARSTAEAVRAAPYPYSRSPASNVGVFVQTVGHTGCGCSQRAVRTLRPSR